MLAQSNQLQTVEYHLLTDEQLVELAQNGENSAQDYLIEKYRNFVRAKIKPYFLVGGAKEDVFQEGMIGLFKSIRDYKHNKQASFLTFAEICIIRQVITAVKSATRMKHSPLNSSVSLDKPLTDDEENERTLLDIYEEKCNSPEELMIVREQTIIFKKKADESLSRLEKQVLELYIKGQSYQEISQSVGRSVKTIDNALQRVKKKIDQIMEKDN